jgi:hypothetical protein
MKPHTDSSLLAAGQKRRVLACCVALLLAASMSNAVVAQSVEPSSVSLALGSEVSQVPVGEVSLVLGRAWIQSAGQPRALIAPGTIVRQSDRIQTESNGHVHIRFVDQALVSVRPDSLLEIVQYDFVADRPGNTSIKLNLQEGVTRSISGKGASSARDRFRLNTPIAAIGVRGTDFVVSASRQSVRAAVNEGTIVMAPFSSDCSVDSFGPCLTNAIELTESSLQILEIQSAGGVPELLPATLERDPEMMRNEVAQALAMHEQAAPADEKTAGTDVFLENVTSMRVQQVVATAAPVVNPPVIAQPGAPETAPPGGVTPVAPVPLPALTDRNLVWGRWGAGQGELEKLTMAYADVRTGRDVTVGNSSYVLFRDGDGKTRIQAGLGPVSFALHSAQAFYHSDSGVVAMTVLGGSLDINFNNNQFATELNMNHSLTGNVDFIANGFIFDGGYFYTRSATERMAGAVSLDGTEAGYFFEKQLASGGIQGLTLWDRR